MIKQTATLTKPKQTEEKSVSEQTVYLSELPKDKYTNTCKMPTDILEKHTVRYSFLKGTEDIWCPDYMPVFGRETAGHVFEILKNAFPNKQIETINYNEVAQEGGLLNCTT